VIDLVHRVGDAIEARGLLRPRQKILVAVSGGLDSMVLLEVLRRLASARRCSLFVAHLNHRLRGRSSDADERLVRATCRRHRIPCVIGRTDVRRIAAARRISVEMAARAARHEFLAKVARERGIPTVALAHHADDQVELFFLRLLRGAGTDGLSGMKWISPSPADERLTLVRPMMDLTKADLLTFAAGNKVRFREDASNACLDILRNRVRHELVPRLIKDYQPALPRVVLRNMEILGAESGFLDALAGEWIDGGSPIPFEELAVAVQRRVLQRGLLALGAEPEFEWIERLRKIPNGSVTVGPELTVRHDGQGRVYRVESSTVEFGNGFARLDLAGQGGRGRFGGLEWRWQIRKPRAARMPKFCAGAEWFDADKVGPTIALRHWRPGDRFQPIGLAASVKLQDLFVNARIPRADRHRKVVATTAGGEIWWVEGLRISEKFKLGPATKRRLEWSWRRGESR
jgi:tRNA(Ile)-lysidine synthase